MFFLVSNFRRRYFRLPSLSTDRHFKTFFNLSEIHFCSPLFRYFRTFYRIKEINNKCNLISKSTQPAFVCLNYCKKYNCLECSSASLERYESNCLRLIIYEQKFIVLYFFNCVFLCTLVIDLILMIKI